MAIPTQTKTRAIINNSPMGILEVHRLKAPIRSEWELFPRMPLHNKAINTAPSWGQLDPAM